MLNKHHDLESYYLNRRLQLLEILDQFANESFESEDYEIPDDHWKIRMLENEFSDVIDPENLCKTIKRIYPEHLFKIKRKD